ncbi:MAG: stage III sporulation protein AB [Clostridia bacterium]|nr:stage III sporulation protein AB [Clostridia bacterium]
MRWQGVLCFSVFLSLLAGFLCGEERKKTEEMAGLLWLWQGVKREIVCFARPLPDIFRELPRDGRLPKTFYQKLDENGLSAALTDGNLHLNAEEKKTLLGFARRLGTALSAEEEKDCEACIRYLSDKEKEKRAEEGDRMKLCRSLVLCLGGMVMLLFL